MAEKMSLTSEDIRGERIARLREDFPDVFTEGKVDFDRLKQALGEEVAQGRERYGLSWAGKSEVMRNIQTPSVATLVPDREESVEFDATENLFIEGDNLEVLMLLQKGYHGQVKMIYIDPPYNTGNEFIYPDNFREGIDDYLRYSGQVSGNGIKLSTNTETSGRYHSKWLNMMYPRLFLARNLLREDGVIFVSIDDHEVHNLRLLMNEVFGEENFVAELVWEKGRKNDAKFFSVGHEYLAVYARSLATLRELGAVWREPHPGAQEIWEKYVGLRDKYGADHKAVEKSLRDWYRQLPNGHPSKALSRYKQVDEHGPWRDKDISWPGGSGPRYEVVHPATKQPCKIPERGWVFASSETMQEQIRKGLVVFREDHTQPPFRKAHLRPIPEGTSEDDAPPNGDDEAAVGMRVMPSVIYKQSQVTVKYLRDLLGGKIFDNPKDYEVLARLTRYVTAPHAGDIVLDFFAGSGSTAEAILDLNTRDDGNRKFILVQLPEPTPESSPARQAGYANVVDIGKERVRLVIKKLNDEERGKLKAEDEPPRDRGFKVFKLTSSNFKIWDNAVASKEPEDLADQLRAFAENVDPDRSREDILYEILLKSGLPLTAEVESLEVAGREAYAVSGGLLMVCLEDQVDDELMRAVVEHGPERFVCLDTAFDGNDKLKTNTVLQMKDHGIEFRTV
jgi:adenine-specific DNA-methyltransferase